MAENLENCTQYQTEELREATKKFLNLCKHSYYSNFLAIFNIPLVISSVRFCEDSEFNNTFKMKINNVKYNKIYLF